MKGVVEDSAGAAASAMEWVPGSAPVAVVMIARNEAHHMEAVLENLRGWAQEVFLVDSFSTDDTVEIARRFGVHVVQRAFRDFGDQWNFALSALPIRAPWTMKLDPDERLSHGLKESIARAVQRPDVAGMILDLRLWFMGRPLHAKLRMLRVWRTGSCRFTDVAVNEHPIVDGKVIRIEGELEHHDSPDLHHWIEKQNRYTTKDAIASYLGNGLAAEPRLFGTPLQRRMWIKHHFMRFPFRYLILFLYHYIVRQGFRAGWVGYAWSRLRSDVYRLREYKIREIQIRGGVASVSVSDSRTTARSGE